MALKQLISDYGVVDCLPETPIKEVAGLMKYNNVGAVVVCKKKKPIGIITDRDLVVRCLADGADCSKPVSTIMTSPVEALEEHSAIADVVARMQSKRVRRLVITDGGGEAKGLVSAGDVFELLANEMNQLSMASSPHQEKLFQYREAAW